MAIPDARTWDLPATLATIDRICSEADVWISRLGLDGERFAHELLLREALTNAVVHGSGADPARHVVCRMQIQPGQTRLEVGDDGAGFDPHACSLDPPGPRETHGRGLSLLHAYADEVQYRPPGNHVTLLRKHRTHERDTMNLLEIQRIGTEVHVKPLVDIKSTILGELHPLLKDAIDPAVTAMVFDLSAIRMVDSGGIGLLIATNNSLGKQGARLVIRGASKDVVQLLKMTRLDRHFVME